MSKEELVYRVEEKVAKAEINTRAQLVEYLADLKNKGLLTKGQIDANMDELACFLGESVQKNGKIGIRTPKTMEYAYSNVSAGFSSTGMLTLIAMSVPVLAAMASLLSK